MIYQNPITIPLFCYICKFQTINNTLPVMNKRLSKSTRTNVRFMLKDKIASAGKENKNLPLIFPSFVQQTHIVQELKLTSL